MPVFQRMLRMGGYLNFAIAALHVAMMVLLKQICQLLGTPAWMARMFAEGWTGWARLYLMIGGIAAFIGLLGLYGLSGAGRIRKLPLLRTGLVLTAGIFIFRSTELIGDIGALLEHGFRSWWQSLGPPSTSLFALAIGLLYLVGAVGLWRDLRPAQR